MQVYRLETDSSVTYARGCKSRATFRDVCDDFVTEVCTTRGSRTVRKDMVVCITCAQVWVGSVSETWRSDSARFGCYIIIIIIVYFLYSAPSK